MDSLLSKKSVFNLIAESSNYGNLGLFVGAGLPMAVLNTAGNKIVLNWKELIHKVSSDLDIQFDEISKEGATYPEMASTLCKTYARKQNIPYNEAVKKLKDSISSLTSWYPETNSRIEYSGYFDLLKPAWIITTNYDLIIEGILTGRGYSLTPADSMVAPSGFIPVYHLHGIRTDPSSIVFTQEDYVALFRPNQYRQQKLPLTLKESVTILIGYNLGDFNVLTAVDWSRNVFIDQPAKYPQDIILFNFTSSPSKNPYKDDNDITILEYSDLRLLLKELSEFVAGYNIEAIKHKDNMMKLNSIFKSPSEKVVDRFIDDEKFRINILTLLNENRNHLITGFLELFSRSVDETWERAKPYGAFLGL